LTLIENVDDVRQKSLLALETVQWSQTGDLPALRVIVDNIIPIMNQYSNAD